MTSALPRSDSPGSDIRYPGALETSGAPGFVSLQEIVITARRYLLTLLGLPIAFGLLGLYAALAQHPTYQATVLVQLDPKPTQPLARSTEIYDPGYETSSYYHTQVKLIESRKLAAALVDRLRLDEKREFGGTGLETIGILERLMGWIPGLPDAPPPLELSQDEVRQLAVEAVMEAIQAKIAPGTTLIEIRFESGSAELAADAANALADIYIEELLQARLDIYTKATEWISSKLGDVSGDLSEAERGLQEYRESRDLVNVGGNRALVEDELAENSQRLREAQRTRVRLENQHAEVRRLTENPTDISGAQSLLLDPVVKDAANSFIAAKSEVSSVESRYGTRHPQYLAAAARLDEAERSYIDQLRIKARGLASELEVARQNEARLRADVRNSRARLQALDRDEFQLNMLERRVHSNRQLYDLFLARFNETESNSSFTETNARIADPAVPPTEPYRPNKKVVLVVSVVLGAILAIALVLIRQLLHTKLELPEEVEELTTIPLIGVVPACREQLLKKSASVYMQKHPRAAFSDAIRSIKTALLMSSGARSAGRGSVYAITSAEPAEGKTTLCVALGSALASGYRVLLVDADMRRPTMARHFDKHSSRISGLSDLLTTDVSIEDATQSSEHAQLDYIMAGHPTPNPGMLLESERIATLIAQIRERYDFVLIDTPPVLAAGDALHLTKHIDGHLLVTRAEKTHKQAFMGMLKRLETVGARSLGVIMNGAVLKRSTYTGYYYYGSTYKY